MIMPLRSQIIPIDPTNLHSQKNIRYLYNNKIYTPLALYICISIIAVFP